MVFMNVGFNSLRTIAAPASSATFFCLRKIWSLLKCYTRSTLRAQTSAKAGHTFKFNFYKLGLCDRPASELLPLPNFETVSPRAIITILICLENWISSILIFVATLREFWTHLLAKKTFDRYWLWPLVKVTQKLIDWSLGFAASRSITFHEELSSSFCDILSTHTGEKPNFLGEGDIQPWV